MKASDRKLGMHRAITRRDFVHDLGLASLGLSLPLSSWANPEATAATTVYYPPVLTGLRGSHPGSFEVAHSLAREHKIFDQPRVLDESYDLIVVGGGLSGLSAAWFYRQLHGDGAKILVLDNHDDFGGHAKRNEFHQGGSMRLAWGGTVNMEYTKYSTTAKGLLDDLGINIPRLLEHFEFGWLENSTGLMPATWFDAKTYGRDVLLPGSVITGMPPAKLAGLVSTFPISESAQTALKNFLLSTGDVLAGMSNDQKQAYLRATSYLDFMREHFALPDEAVQIFSGGAKGFWGVQAENLSVAECLETGLPGRHVLGDFVQSRKKALRDRAPQPCFPMATPLLPGYWCVH